MSGPMLRVIILSTLFIFIVVLFLAAGDQNRTQVMYSNPTLRAALQLNQETPSSKSPGNKTVPEGTTKIISTTMIPKDLKGKPELHAEFLKDYYSKQAPMRSQQLLTIQKQTTDFATLYNVLVPEVYCPDMVRVGNVNDGGKWVCNPAAMPKSNCSVYSLGLRDDISFDADLQAFNNKQCRLYGFDVTPQSEHTRRAYEAINGKAFAKKIVPKTNGTSQASLGDILRGNGDNYTEILKMDIEGGEYTTLIPFLREFQVCQILLEMHGNPYEMLQLLTEIAKLDYGLYFFEVNGNSMKACEYSFIHSSCAKRYGAFELAPYLKNAARN